MSIGLTRIFAKFVAEGRITGGPQVPAEVLVVVPSASAGPTRWRPQRRCARGA